MLFLTDRSAYLENCPTVEPTGEFSDRWLLGQHEKTPNYFDLFGLEVYKHGYWDYVEHARGSNDFVSTKFSFRKDRDGTPNFTYVRDVAAWYSAVPFSATYKACIQEQLSVVDFKLTFPDSTTLGEMSFQAAYQIVPATSWLRTKLTGEAPFYEMRRTTTCLVRAFDKHALRLCLAGNRCVVEELHDLGNSFELKSREETFARLSRMMVFPYPYPGSTVSVALEPDFTDTSSKVGFSLFTHYFCAEDKSQGEYMFRFPSDYQPDFHLLPVRTDKTIIASDDLLNVFTTTPFPVVITHQNEERSQPDDGIRFL